MPISLAKLSWVNPPSTRADRMAAATAVVESDGTHRSLHDRRAQLHGRFLHRRYLASPLAQNTRRRHDVEVPRLPLSPRPTGDEEQSEFCGLKLAPRLLDLAQCLAFGRFEFV